LNRKITLGAIMVAIIVELALIPAIAMAGVNTISISPSVVNFGSTTTITLTTDRQCAGTMSVKDPNGVVITSGTNVNIGAGGGSQTWTWPTDFPGAAYIIGPYDVTAAVTMAANSYVWQTSFVIEFFVVPELPLGILMATIASFAAMGMLKKYKTRQ
jgi:hypothetical protein